MVERLRLATNEYARLTIQQIERARQGPQYCRIMFSFAVRAQTPRSLRILCLSARVAAVPYLSEQSVFFSDFCGKLNIPAREFRFPCDNFGTPAYMIASGALRNEAGARSAQNLVYVVVWTCNQRRGVEARWLLVG